MPAINNGGQVVLPISLETLSVIKNDLLTIDMGKDFSFFPADKCQIFPPGAKGGDKEFLIAKINEKNIGFKAKINEIGETSFYSHNYPGWSIKREQDNLLLQDNRGSKDYLFFSDDAGYTWRLSSIRNSHITGMQVKCKYDNNGLMTAIVMPDETRYKIEYKDGLAVKVSDPAGAVTNIEWDDKSHIKSVETVLTSSHPFYPSSTQKSAAKKQVAAAVVRSIKAECDATGRLITLVNSSGEKYTVEYRSDLNPKKKTDYLCSIIKNPTGSIVYLSVINNSDGTRKVEKGFVEIEKGKEKFLPSHETFFARKNSTLVITAEKVDGVEVKKYLRAGNTTGITEKIDALGRATKYQYNDIGLVTATIYPDDSKATIKYDANGYVTERTNESDRITKYVYEKGLLVALNEAGIVTRYEYNENKCPVKTIMPDGTVHSFEWDNLFRLVSHTKPDGTKTEYTYARELDETTEIKTVSADGKESYSKSFAYDPKGRLVKISYPDSTTEGFVYDCCNIVKTIDKAGAVTKYAYNEAHRKVMEVSANGDKTSFEYDSKGRLAKTIYPNKTESIIKYDKWGNKSEIVRPDGTWEKHTYDAVGNKIAMEKSDGTKSEYAYDKRNRLISITGDAERNVSYKLSPSGENLSTTDHGLPFDKNGRETFFSFDKAGRFVKTTRPDGTIQSNVYEGMSRRLISSERNGIITVFRYNTAGQLVSTAKYTTKELSNAPTKADKEALFKSKIRESRTYDAFGNPCEIRNKTGRLLTRYSYSPDGRLGNILRPLSETGAEKQSYVYKYGSDGIVSVSVYSRMIENPNLARYDYREDCGIYQVAALGGSVKAPELGRLVSEYAEKAGRRLWSTDQLGNKTEYKYNERGQLTQLVSDKEVLSSFAYDKFGRVAETEDVLGRMSKKVYGEDNRLAKLIQPDGSASDFDYDKFGRMVKREGAGAYPLSYNYTSFGEISSYTDGNGAETKFEYNPQGRLSKRIWADGSVTSYKHNDRGLLTAKEEAGRVTGYIYDDANRLVKIETVFGNESAVTEMKYDKDGRLAEVKDANSSVKYSYDPFGRMSMEEGPVGIIKYVYNERGFLAARGCEFKGEKGAFITKYYYDELNRVEKVASPAGEFVYTYDGKGRIESLKMGEALITYSYDKAGRLLSKKMGDTVLCAYEYDKLDRRVKAEVNGVAWNYKYDKYSQLIASDSSTGNKYNYNYDKIGNRIKFNEYAMAYNKLNQIAVNGYKYDAWGNLIQTPDASYKYDLQNRLMEVKKGNVTVSYKYDALGQRIESKEIVGEAEKTAKFLMSGMVEYARFSENKAQYHTLGLDLAQSLNKTGAVGAVLASTKGGDSFHYLYDGNGNVTATCDSKGAIKEKVAYSPFGENLSRINLPFTFCSKATDASGLSYYGYRFYNSADARWTNRDPIQELGGINFYGYMANRVINLIEYLGLYDSNATSFDNFSRDVTQYYNAHNEIASYTVEVQLRYENIEMNITSRAVDESVCSSCKEYTTSTCQAKAYLKIIKETPEIPNWPNATTYCTAEELTAYNKFINAVTTHENGHATIAKKWFSKTKVFSADNPNLSDCSKDGLEKKCLQELDKKADPWFEEILESQEKEQEEWNKTNPLNIPNTYL